MLFNSLEFVLFFIVVTGLFFVLPHRYRWVLLLAASCFFYMFFKPIYILILGFTIVIDYYAGILIENEQDEVRRKRFLSMSIIANLGVLAVFKYYNFFNDNITSIADAMGYKNHIPYLHILLPIGLSFHTFQAMSYTIEIYRENQKAERHFGIYSLYVMFYPQLVAGPIERPQNVLHQFHEEKRFSYDNAVSGLRLMLWGMFKKVVIADRLAVVTDTVFNYPQGYGSVATAIAALLFTFQVYCDFSGYSNIAIGAAKVMGFDLMTNFNRPFNSKSVSEYWRRWHISLSTWFNDYLFTPMSYALRLKGLWGVAFSAVVTFVLSGLWHGAAWHYVIWGGLHGLAIAYEILTQKSRKKIYAKMPKKLVNTIGMTATFTLACVTCIFFRANNVPDALVMLKKLPGIFTELPGMLSKGHFNSGLNVAPARLALCFLVIGVMEFVHFLQRKHDVIVMIEKWPRMARWSVYYALLLSILYLGIFTNREFIYFQF